MEGRENIVGGVSKVGGHEDNSSKAVRQKMFYHRRDDLLSSHPIVNIMWDTQRCQIAGEP